MTKLSAVESYIFIPTGRPWCISRSSSWLLGLTSRPLLSTVTSISIVVMFSAWPTWIAVTSSSASEWKIPSLSTSVINYLITGLLSATYFLCLYACNASKVYFVHFVCLEVLQSFGAQLQLTCQFNNIIFIQLKRCTLFRECLSDIYGGELWPTNCLSNSSLVITCLVLSTA